MTTHYFSTLDTRSRALIYKSGETPRASSGESPEGKKLNVPKEAPSSKPNARFDKKAQLQEANRIKEFESELADIAFKSGVRAIALRPLVSGDKPHTSADLFPLKAKIMDALEVIKICITSEQARYLNGVTIVLDPFNSKYAPKFPTRDIMLVDCASLSISDIVRAIADNFRYHEDSAVSDAKKRAQKYALGIPSFKGALDEFGEKKQIQMADDIFSLAKKDARGLDALRVRQKLESELSPLDKKKVAIAHQIATRLLNRLVASGNWLSHTGFGLDPNFPGCLIARLVLETHPTHHLETMQTLDKVTYGLLRAVPHLLSFIPPDNVRMHYSFLDLKDLEKWNKIKNYEELIEAMRSSKRQKAANKK